MQKNKSNKIVILISICLILIVSFLIFILNYSKDDSSLSILEKKWVNDNKNNIVDVSVFNNVPLYGLNGSGVTFDILDYFTSLHEIKFNKNSYLVGQNNNLGDIKFTVVDDQYKLTKNDILLFTDNYVLVSMDKNVISDIHQINSKKIGVFDNDISSVSYYLSDAIDTSYQPYENIDNMINGLKGGEVDYIVIPSNLYLNYILSNDLHIIFNIDELYKNYIFTINDSDLLGIMKKAINVYNKEKLDEFYNEEFLNVFFTYKNISSEDIENYKLNNYNYGFVINMPYENVIDNEFVGIFSNYTNEFSKITGINFNFHKYDSIKDIKDDFSKGELDIIFSNYDVGKLNIDSYKTISPVDERYVVLSKENIIANSIKSLKDYKINVVKNTYLHGMLKNLKIDVKEYDNTDELVRNVKSDSVVILDELTYNYYKNNKFKDYLVVYNGTLNNEYTFLIKDVRNNKAFIELFDYYISTVNFKKIRNNYNTNYVVKSDLFHSVIIRFLAIFVSLFVVGLIVLRYFYINKKNNKKISKEDKIKYIDALTSLKNRNYLNYNMKKWNDNIIYPQAIVIVDLNNIKFINDNYGHEEGDDVIRKAANILIVNQKENTDIIRTDGNEFLIYMVGYSEQEVVAFNRKLNKELKELPYSFGAAIGYSMILDDLKTIDDAINEATLLMREIKEKL